MLNIDGFRAIKSMAIHTQKMSKQQRQEVNTKSAVLEVITNNDMIKYQRIGELTGFAMSTVYRVVDKLVDEKSIVKKLGDKRGTYGNIFLSAVVL